MTHLQYLESKQACSDALNWIGSQSIEESWATCKRSDWMLWALETLNYDPITMRRIACAIVRRTPLADGRTVWDLLTDERSRTAVIVAEKWCDGLATDEDLDAAWDAAWDAVAAARDAQSDIIREYVTWQDVERMILLETNQEVK